MAAPTTFKLRSLVQEITPDRAAIGLLLLGVFLRFFRLGDRSLWLDEIFAADTTRFDTFDEVFRWATTDPQEMPLVNVIAWLLRGLGDGDWVVRLPAALAGSFCVLAMYGLGKTVSRPRTGLIAALFMAVLPFAVWFSQEARPYTFLMLFTTLQMLFAYRAVCRNRFRDWFWLAFCTVVNIYSHILALAPTAAAFGFIGLVLLLDLTRIGSNHFTAMVRRWVTAHLPPLTLRKEGKSGDIPGWENGRVRVSFELDRPSTSPWRALLAWRRLVRRLGAASLTGALVLAAYSPWVPYLNEYLNRSGIGAGTNVRPPAATAAQVGSLFTAFGFSNILLMVMGVGAVVVTAGLFRHRWKEALLVTLWLAIPTGVFWFRLGSGMVTVFPRYYSCLFPAGVLLVAIGVDGIAATIHGLTRQIWSKGRKTALVGALPAISTAVVTVFLLTAVPNLWGGTHDATAAIRESFVLRVLHPVVPALAQSYDLDKDDYKGVADHIIATSRGDSTVIAMGGCASYIAKSLPYYFRIRRSSIPVIDGALVDNEDIDWLRRSKGSVWGVVFTACSPPDNVVPASRAEMKILPFSGLDLVLPHAPAATAVDQALAILTWGRVLHPAVAPSVDLVRVFSRGQGLGGDLLASAPTLWAIPPDVTADEDRQSFVLRSNESEVNATFPLENASVIPGQTYVMSFEYRNAEFTGEQKVYVSAHTQEGVWTATFPDGSGYLTRDVQAWTPGAFAFIAPPDTVMLQTWLRATGSGVSEFRAVQLRQVL